MKLFGELGGINATALNSLNLFFLLKLNMPVKEIENEK